MYDGPICDPHHHLWKDWPGGAYSPADLRADVQTVPNVVRTVFVECNAWYRTDGPEHLRVVGETEWVAANAEPLTQGIVGTADLRSGPLAVETLEAHVAAGGGRFRGIRQRATWDASVEIRPGRPDPGPSLLLDPDFRRGFAVLTEMGLSFDAWLYFPQLPELVDLARAVPESNIVLNHLGAPITLGPYRDRPSTIERWRTLMAEVATCPNVSLKVGGIGMPMFGFDWHKRGDSPDAAEVVASWGEPIRWCIETFGVGRCMFESNFPVDKVSMSYATLWEAFDIISRDLAADDRAALFHDTAVAVYRLEDDR
jgi:L-fuconolactonase